MREVLHASRAINLWQRLALGLLPQFSLQTSWAQASAAARKKGELVKWLTNGFCFWSLLIKLNALAFQMYLQKEVCKDAATKGCNRSENTCTC